ncbi:unnamed protein product [Effrenium voratum]|nr:unnamed protein product [Effrenium voratum]
MTSATRERNGQVNGLSNYKRAAPIFHREDHRIYLIILALDYANSPQRLPSVTNAKHIEELAKECGVHDVLTLYNHQCTKDAVRRALKNAGSRCDVNDYFILYFEGHATVLSDPDDQALSAVCTLLGLGVEELCGQMIWGMHRYRWMWGNFKSAGDRRF